MVELSTCDVIPGLIRPIATEIDNPPLLTQTKRMYFVNGTPIHEKQVLNPKRKLWSTEQMVLPFLDYVVIQREK